MSADNDVDDIDVGVEENFNGTPSKVPHLEESETLKLNNWLSEESSKLREVISVVSKINEIIKKDYVQNCSKWMTICCNVDSYSDSPISLESLRILIKQSALYPELNTSVSHFIRTKFFTKFFKNFVLFEEGWKCVELCLTHYKNSCNAYYERLKEASLSQIEKNNASMAVLKVYSLLPIIGEGGSSGANYTNRWKIQFEDTLKICNWILQELFKDVVESQTYEDIVLDRPCYSAETSTVDEKFLYKLFYNYCCILCFMLTCPFPAPKSILPQKVFDIICRCLNVSSKTLGSLDTTQKIKLSDQLPHFHIVANNLLKALVLTCKSQLLPYSFLITKLTHQTLQSVDKSKGEKRDELCLKLSITAYDVWIQWVIVSNGSGAVKSCNIALAALEDLSHISSSVKSDAEDNSAETSGEEPGHSRSCFTENHLQLAFAMVLLKTLQVYIREAGVTLKAEQLKLIQMYVVKNILNIQRCHSLEFPYISAVCRYELYCLLMELVNCHSTARGSPVNWALDLFKQGIYDLAPEVSNFCSSALPNVQNIIDQETIRVAPTEEMVLG